MFVKNIDNQNSFGLKVKGQQTKSKINNVKDKNLKTALVQAVDIFCRKTQEKGVKGGFVITDINSEKQTLAFNIVSNIPNKAKSRTVEGRFGRCTQIPIHKETTNYQISLANLQESKQTITDELVDRFYKAIKQS